MALILIYGFHREAKPANRLAAASNVISEHAVAEAKRSGNAAHASLELQQAEAVAATDLRARGERTEVRPLRCKSRAAAPTGPPGLQVRNFGPGMARKVTISIRQGESSFRTAHLEVLAPSETVSVTQALEDWVPSEAVNIPAVSRGKVATRVCWKHADESEGDTG